MPVVSLPDGSQRDVAASSTIADLAASIGPGLAKAALAGVVNDTLVDLTYPIEADCGVRIITDKDPEGLEVIRHSCAHLMAQAVKQLFPQAQVTIGPVIEDGFYYDFAFGRTFTPEDLTAIEKRMKEIASQALSVERSVMTRDEAIAFFKELGEMYKVRIIEDIPNNENLTFYKQGDFVDLCRGPHVPNTNKIKAFKLTKLAGAYWRGDSNNEMLQRIYGTAWASKKDLADYLHCLEEAEKRDHRKLAAKQDLFHIQPEAPGMIFWHEKGWQLYLVIQKYIRDLLSDHGYQEIRTPQLVDYSLWEKSGHADKFNEEMFSVSYEDREFAIKPMNCPCHVEVFKQGLKSYRDLPIRLAEFGSCHRREPSGTLHGLMRIRNFVQDDAHIFCTEDQVPGEVANFIKLVEKVYKDFGYDGIEIKLSTRPDKRVGSDAVWDKSEAALEQVLNESGLAWELNPGEGAFYGPKVEFALRDCLNRIWQCGTVQLDFSMPERLGATYVAEDSSKKVPVMIHRAILGSFERFIGVLLEEYAGSLPLWLAPVQVSILNISEKQTDYSKKVVKNLKKHGYRAKYDLRNEKIGFKIRSHTLERVPYLLIIGDKEVEGECLAVRTREGEDLGSMSMDEFVTLLKERVETKR